MALDKTQGVIVEIDKTDKKEAIGLLGSGQARTLLSQVSKASNIESNQNPLSLSAIFEGGAPMDSIEAMLMAHLTTLHNHLMHFMHRLAIEEGKSDWDERMDAEMDRVTKIHKQFLKTVDTLLHYKNKGYNRCSIEAKSNG